MDKYHTSYPIYCEIMLRMHLPHTGRVLLLPKNVGDAFLFQDLAPRARSLPFPLRTCTLH